MLPRPIWLLEDGPDSDVVVSTRARLARNLQGIPFPWRATPLQKKNVAESVINAAGRAGGPWRNSRNLTAERMNPEEIERLVEFRYTSAAWCDEGPHRWVLICRDNAVSAMVNEEDHLRIQTILPGFQPEDCFERNLAAERSLAGNLTFAADNEIGFLTSALTNAGAALRISIILHMPALRKSGSLETRLGAASELGASVRGLYGEGTEAIGAFFQVSNRRSFGLHMRDILGEVASSASMLIAAERAARESLYRPESGRTDLAEEVYTEITEVIRGDPELGRLLESVSILRLGAAEKLLDVRMNQTAEWISMAGVSAAFKSGPELKDTRFQSVRRSAALRISLRAVLQREGTLTGGITG